MKANAENVVPLQRPSRKLAVSPNFVLCHAADGSTFASGEVEPYPQYWLSQRDRLLLALFGQKGGLKIGRAIETLLAPCADGKVTAERRHLERAIAGMVKAGILIEPSGELSRYGKAMAQDYLRNRPFPLEIAEKIASDCAVQSESHVLDLASGPGSLALEMARRTPHVTIMELSRGFVAAAVEEAAERGLALETINESCNRLAQLDGQYNLVTISQALHWLDDIAVCKGVCRVLADGGSFLVIHAAMNLPEHHPLSWILGDRTPLGNKALIPFADQVRPLYRRLALLFAALDAPHVERHDPLHSPSGLSPIRGASIDLYHQPRTIDEGFARAFLSDTHIASTGQTPEAVWSKISADCGTASDADLKGSMDWAVLRFQRGANDLDLESWMPGKLQTIAYP